jgi:lysophospholipase L1-like esterase
MSLLIVSIITLSSVIKDNKIDLNRLYPNPIIDIKHQQEWQMNLYEERIEHFKKHPIGNNKIVFLGNSITEGGGDWNKKFNVHNIVNRGISGDITEGILVRLDEIIFYKPIAVFLLIGINDIFDTDILNREKITPLYVANNIIKIANQIIDQSPSTEIFIQTILPVNHEIYIEENGFFPEHNVPLSEQIIQINSMIIHQADVQQYKVIDLHSLFINQDGLMNREYTTDGVHLNHNGYGVWVKCIHSYIQESQIKN